MTQEKTSKDKKEDSDKHQPITDRARAAIMEFGIHPKNRQDRRIFTHINSKAPFPLSMITPYYDFLEQLIDIESIKEDEKGEIYFEPNPAKHNDIIPEIIEEILLLGTAVNGKRVEMAYDMVKNMNRPAFNPMAALSGMLGNKTDETITEEVPENE